MKYLSSFLIAVLAIFLIAGSDKRQLPQSSALVRADMAKALGEGDRIALTHRAVELAQMGGSLSEASLNLIEPMLDEATLTKSVWPKGWESDPSRKQFLIQRLRNNGQFTDDYDNQHAPIQVPAEYHLVEGIALDHRPDSVESRLFIGTVTDGRLAYIDLDTQAGKGMFYAASPQAQWREIDLGSPKGGLFGMAIDHRRRLLWIATGLVEQTAVAGDTMTGLIAVDLDRLNVAKRIPLANQNPGVAGDVAIAEDGTVYVSNSKSGAIHRCRPGCSVLEDMIPSGAFKSPQGMALSKNGKTLFIADYSIGLWRVHLGKNKAMPVKIKSPTMLDGIDGMKMMQDSRGREWLFAIQNGTNPRRIIRINMGSSREAVEVQELSRLSATGPEPTLATTDGDDMVFYISDGQWERYGAGGILHDGGFYRPTPIRSSIFFDITSAD